MSSDSTPYSTRRNHRLHDFLVCAAALLSGGAALGYEICWSRALVVPLGNSTDATALVLAAFMLGIAVGARLGGGFGERTASPLRVYAWFELWLALSALLAPRLIASLSHLSGVGLRYAAGGLSLLFPCVAMGATLPLLVRALTRPGMRVGQRISLVYGANTAGAAAGAFITGFWGIARLGVSACSAALAGASLGAAALAYWAGARAERPSERARTGEARVPARRLRRIALASAFVCGFSMLACEVVWARVLSFVFGHDTYAFASLLAFVLLGLALGGLGHRWMAGRDQLSVLGGLLGGFGGSLLGSFWAASSLVIRHGRDPFGLAGSSGLAASIWLELYRELAYTPVLVLLPSLLAGALFPTACSLYAGGAPDAGRQVGQVGLVNGVGSALGALVAALGLVSATSIQGALLAMAAGAGALALLTLRPSAAVSGALPLLALAAIAARMPRRLPEQMLLEIVGPRHQRLAYYEEARTATVAVTQNQINGERQLLINSVNEVTTRLVHDQSFKLLGHLGPLLHRDPKTAVMICLGAGISAGAALTHPLERLDVIDLSSAVPRAARYFVRENRGVLDDPRFHLYTDDGRQFLLNHARPYDLAIIDSTHPKSVDSWLLYTREFYQLVRARLGAGGIAVQWLPLHGLSEREFKLIVHTFVGVFGETTLWANAGFETYGQVAYAKLVGVNGGPLRIHYPELERKLHVPSVRGDLLPYGMANVEELLDLFVAGPDSLRAWTEGLPDQTDDHPIVPYTTVFSHGRRMAPALLLGVRSPVIPWLHGLGPADQVTLESAYEAGGLVLAGKLTRAVELRPQGSKLALFVAQSRTTLPYYTALSRRYPDDPERLFEAGAQLAALGFPKEAAQSYERALLVRPHDFKLRLNYARLRLALGEQDQAIDLLARLRGERPGSAIVIENLGAALLATGDAEAARSHLRESLGWDPASLSTRLLMAEAALQVGDVPSAQRELTRTLADNPWVAEGEDLLGVLELRRGDPGAAVVHARRAIRLDPYRTTFHLHLGLALEAQCAHGPAAMAYSAALRLEPDAVAALNQLGRVEAAQGDWERAEQSYLDALDRDANFAPALLNLGLGWRGQGRLEEAIQAFCRALELDQAQASARRYLAELGASDEACGD